ncbi:MAG TPA: septum formation initiator family protein, partial [Actinomycetes bacterium]|nr:septum formation initiator family protein [Actinomycetes bacterium]
MPRTPGEDEAVGRQHDRPNLTGRAAMLALVVCMLAISLAYPLREYLAQRSDIGQLRADVSEQEQRVAELRKARERWADPAYVEAQARERLHYVMPGETSYVVLGADGKPLEAETSLRTTREVLAQEPTAWFQTAWSSVLLAGNPPVEEEKPEPLDKIGPD